MQFSNFFRREDGNKIYFYNSEPLTGITNIRYFQDDSAGSFTKKEFRWSFNKSYWSSWEDLDQGNISGISIGSNPLLFLDIRYTSSGGKVTKFTLDYTGTPQTIADPNCNSNRAINNLNVEIASSFSLTL